MQTSGITHAHWRKSTRSFANNECVEVTSLRQGVAVRDSTLSDTADFDMLATPASHWRGFVAQVKNGAFDG